MNISIESWAWNPEEQSALVTVESSKVSCRRLKVMAKDATRKHFPNVPFVLIVTRKKEATSCAQ